MYGPYKFIFYPLDIKCLSCIIELEHVRERHSSIDTNGGQKQ